MKHLIFVLLLSLLFTSCGRTLVEVKRGDSVTISKERDFSYGINFKVIEIDSCEYVVGEEWQRAISIIHKQNCKFCAARKLNQ